MKGIDIEKVDKDYNVIPEDAQIQDVLEQMNIEIDEWIVEAVRQYLEGMRCMGHYGYLLDMGLDTEKLKEIEEKLNEYYGSKR